MTGEDDEDGKENDVGADVHSVVVIVGVVEAVVIIVALTDDDTNPSSVMRKTKANGCMTSGYKGYW